jgi:hypothetical protein
LVTTSTSAHRREARGSLVSMERPPRSASSWVTHTERPEPTCRSRPRLVSLTIGAGSPTARSSKPLHHPPARPESRRLTLKLLLDSLRWQGTRTLSWASSCAGRGPGCAPRRALRPQVARCRPGQRRGLHRPPQDRAPHSADQSMDVQEPDDRPVRRVVTRQPGRRRRGSPSLLRLVFGVPRCGRRGGALAGVWLVARLVSWIGSWGELVSLCRVAHGQQWSTGDCQHEDGNDDDDKDLQITLLGRQPTSDSALAVATALAARRISPPVRCLTAPIDARVSRGAGKGSRVR